MSYYTRSQAQAKHKAQAEFQTEQQHKMEQTEQEQEQEQAQAQERPLPDAWYSVNIPTFYTYRYREEDIIRAMKEVKRILSEIEASESMERVIDLFEYLMQFPFILIVRPSTGAAIQQKIKDFKPIIAEQERRLTAFHAAHETMVKSLAPLDSQVQKAGMHLLREYVVFQKEMARWMHLKDIMGKLESIIKN
jgi:hypothetical protein